MFRFLDIRDASKSVKQSIGYARLYLGRVTFSDRQGLCAFNSGKRFPVNGGNAGVLFTCERMPDLTGDDLRLRTDYDLHHILSRTNNAPRAERFAMPARSPKNRLPTRAADVSCRHRRALYSGFHPAP